tara:strand:- start:959 stop:1144 length:186 start_codon:yes stop_codon:yes gene_type:complete
MPFFVGTTPRDASGSEDMSDMVEVVTESGDSAASLALPSRFGVEGATVLILPERRRLLGGV